MQIGSKIQPLIIKLYSNLNTLSVVPSEYKLIIGVLALNIVSRPIRSIIFISCLGEAESSSKPAEQELPQFVLGLFI